MNIRMLCIYIYIYMVVHIFVCFEHHLGPKLKRYPGGLESLMFKKNDIWESLKTTDWNIKI